MKVRLCSHGEGCAICDADVIIQCQRGELYSCHRCRVFANIFPTRNDRRERNKLFASTLSCSALFHPLRSLSLVLFLLVPVDLMFIITLSRIFFHYKMSEQRTRREQKGMIKSTKYKNLWWMRRKTTEHRRKCMSKYREECPGRCRCQVTVGGLVEIREPDGFRKVKGSSKSGKQVHLRAETWAVLERSVGDLNCRPGPTLGLKKRSGEKGRWKMFLYIFHGKIYLLRGI